PLDFWRARLQKSLYCGFVATRRNLPCNHELHFVSPPNDWWNSPPEPGAVYITVLKYGALSWEDKSETPTNTSGRVAFTHPTKNGCLVTTALHRTNLSRRRPTDLCARIEHLLLRFTLQF